MVSTPEVKIGMNRLDSRAVQHPSGLAASVEAHNGDMYRRALVDPVAVAPRHEDIAGFGDALEHLAAGSAADALRGYQSHGAHLLALDHLPRFLKPIGHQIGLSGDAVVVELEQAST